MTVSSSASRLRQVGPDREIPEPAAAAPAAPQQEQAALGLLLLAIKTIGQRFIIALGHLSAAAALASVWYLFYAALPADPSTHQLIALGLYGTLVLAVLYVRR